MVIVRELSDFLDEVGGLGESLENLSDVGTWLHGDYSKLILFIDPCEESLVIVMEDTSILWPLSVEAAGIKESITFFKQEVIGDKLLLVLL